MTDWLLKFGFGAVQEFIGHARKTRDLAAGSRIISEVAREAISKTFDLYSELVLPYTPEHGCPHQWIVLLTTESDEKVKECGKAMKSAVCERILSRLNDGAIGKAFRTAGKDFEEFIKAQIESSFETYWVAVPVEGGDYRGSFLRLQSLYDRRRWTRTFSQLDPVPDRKQYSCLQCGSRAAVMNRSKERLCAVCLGKRLWSYEFFKDGFPSTVRLSWDRLFREPLVSTMKELLEPVKDGKDGKWDEKMLMDLFERWDEFEDSGTGPDTAGGGDNIEGGWREGFRKLSEDKTFVHLLKDLSPYYSIAVLDGDRMGEWFSGKYIMDPAKLREAQKALSKSLAKFAKELSQTAAQFGGRLVYAGGDDGLALLPLDGMVPFMKAVKVTWDNTVVINSDLAAHCVDAIRPSISCHASVAHRKAPLQSVVARLQKDLAETKERAGRNAFSIRVDVRAGASSMMIGGWEEFDDLVHALALFCAWRPEDSSPDASGLRRWPDASKLKERRAMTLPARLPHRMEGAVAALFDTGGACVTVRGLELESRRQAVRGPVAGRVDPHSVEKFVGWICGRATGRKGKPWPVPEEGWEMLSAKEAFCSVLEVVSFLARNLDWESEG